MNIERQYPVEKTEDAQRSPLKQEGVLHRLRSSYVGTAAKVGVVLFSLLGNAPKTSGAERPENAVRMLFSSDLQQLRDGKTTAGDLSAKILSITDDPTGKEDSFLRTACEEALTIAAEANDERSVIAALEKMKSLPAASSAQMRLFNDNQLAASILVATDKATKANQFAMALQLTDLLESSGLLSADLAWLKRAEILEAKPVPYDVNTKLVDAKQQIELGAKAAEGKHTAAVKKIAIDSDKITQRLPSGEPSLHVRQEILQLLAVGRAMELLEKTGGTKMEHSVLGLFHLSRGNIKEAYAELELGGHPYVTRFPMSDDPLQQFAVAQKIAIDLERATKMSPIEVTRLKNLCAFFARQSLAGNVLMNEKRVLAERLAKLSSPSPTAAPSGIAFTRPTNTPQNPPISIPSRPASPASPAPTVALPANVDLNSVEGAMSFLAAQGCIIEFDLPGKKKAQLTGSPIAIPEGARLYGITVPPQACSLAVLQGMANMTIRTRINLSDCPITNVIGAQFLSKIKQQAVIDLRRTNITDDSVLALQADADITRLGLGQTGIGDTSLIHLAKNPRITAILASMTKITDKGLAGFAGTTHVTYLEIGNTQTSGVGLRHLASSPLEGLKAGNTLLTDADVDAILAFSRLETLDISKTRITGAGILRLGGLQKIKELNITGCAITPLELHRLGEVLPKGCRIVTK